MPSGPYIKTTDASARWSERRLALLKALAVRPQAVNRSWCPRISPGVRSGTPGGDLRRLVREGWAELTHKTGPMPPGRLLPSGERAPVGVGRSEAKVVVVSQKGRELLAQHEPPAPRQAQPWSKRRQALEEAGLAKPRPGRPASRGVGW